MARRPQGLRERKKQELRERIFATATSLFREQGFAETRVEEIAGRVDISLKTFFNYFPAKQAILDEHVARLLADFEELIRAAATAQGPVSMRLRGLARQIAEAVERDRKLALIVLRESRLFNADDRVRKREHQTYQLLADLFREGQKRSEFRNDVDALQIAEIFFATYYLTSVNWLTRWWRTKSGLADRFDDAIKVVLKGVAKAT